MQAKRVDQSFLIFLSLREKIGVRAFSGLYRDFVKVGSIRYFQYH